MSLQTKSSLAPRTSSLFNDLFDEDRLMNFDWGNGWKKVPSANIIEKDKVFQIELAIPGMKKTDFRVDFDNGQLTVSCEKKEETEENYTRKEFSYSSFSRSFFLPGSVNTEKIKAKYQDGILTLELPKREEAKLKKKEIAVG